MRKFKNLHDKFKYYCDRVAPGGRPRVAAVLGASLYSIHQWCAGRPIPPDYHIQLIKLFDGFFDLDDFPAIDYTKTDAVNPLRRSRK